MTYPIGIRVDRADVERVLRLATDTEDRTVNEQRSLLALADTLHDDALRLALVQSWVPGEYHGTCARCGQPAGGPEWLASGLCEDCS